MTNNRDQEERHLTGAVDDVLPALGQMPHAMSLMDRAAIRLAECDDGYARTLAAAIKGCLRRAGWSP